MGTRVATEAHEKDQAVSVHSCRSQHEKHAHNRARDLGMHAVENSHQHLNIVLSQPNIKANHYTARLRISRKRAMCTTPNECVTDIYRPARG